MVGKVGQKMERSGVCQGHVVAASGFYCGGVVYWVYVVAEMSMCWADVGAGGSGVGDGICM